MFMQFWIDHFCIMIIITTLLLFLLLLLRSSDVSWFAELIELYYNAKTCVAGWGRMTIVGSATNILQDAPLVIEDISRCRARTAFNRKFHSSSMICARNPENIFTSGCHGDSGGPLVCENAEGRMILQGVVSWGSSTCDALERATVFTKVASFKQWIEKVTKS